MFTIHPPELFGAQLFANTRIVVALVDWHDEGQGQIAVLVPRYELVLEAMFSNALLIDVPGPWHNEVALPWTRRSLDYIVQHQLPSLGLIAYGYYV